MNRILYAAVFSIRTRRARSDLRKQFAVDMQGQASIPVAVFMPTLVAGARISQQEGSGVQQSLTRAGAVTERSSSHERHRHTIVTLFEGMIVRSGRTHIFRERPLPLMRNWAGTRWTVGYFRLWRALFERSESH